MGWRLVFNQIALDQFQLTGCWRIVLQREALYVLDARGGGIPQRCGAKSSELFSWPTFSSHFLLDTCSSPVPGLEHPSVHPQQLFLWLCVALNSFHNPTLQPPFVSTRSLLHHHLTPSLIL